ncbi:MULTISPECIES: MFS transporter [unclassified Streptomyces]|uniref:MFS transporter n=1 Tax=unclassified Streptomyces TaxID=2593676 RepID=UPI0004770561|nr:MULTISPECIES: MFS transporter [unclassified Streptomyces]MYT31957.1 MFS transporter [Streptomyces sp. SID8354]
MAQTSRPAEAAHAAPAPLPAPPVTASRGALALILTGAFVAVLDTFIVMVAAPAIQADLHASDADVQLILAGYQLTYAIALITGARLGDRFGRKRLFQWGMALFTLSSVGCALAPGAGVLIAARLAQGFSAAAMFPQVFAMLQVLVPAERRARAFGALGAVIGIAGAVGQLLGGVLVSADLFGSSWRPIFWVNVPVGLVALVLTARHVPETRAPEARRLDLPGAGVLTLALGLLIVPLVEGRAAGWPRWAWCSLAASVLAFVAFAFVERRVDASGGAPLVRLRLFRERPFAVGMTLVLLTYAGINSFFLIFSLTLQDGLGQNALGAGLFYLPFAVVFFAASLLAGRLARFGRRVLQAGALLVFLGFAGTVAMTTLAGPELTAWYLVPTLALVGAGNGLLVTPLLSAVLAGVRPEETGMASGVLSTGQQVGGAVGVAVIGVLFYGALGPAAHQDAVAYGHALRWALTANAALAALVSLLLPLLPAPATRRG